MTRDVLTELKIANIFGQVALTASTCHSASLLLVPTSPPSSMFVADPPVLGSGDLVEDSAAVAIAFATGLHFGGAFDDIVRESRVVFWQQTCPNIHAVSP